MYNTDIISEKVEKRKPRVYFTKIVFNDGTELQLNNNSIIVFTGANNCGKSQVLKDLEKCVENNEFMHNVIIKTTAQEYTGDIDEDSFIMEHFHKYENGYYHLLGTGCDIDKNYLKELWSTHRLLNDIYRTMIHRLSTEERLQSSNALIRQDNIQNHPICKMYNNSTLADTVSEYFRQAFDTDLIVNEKDITTIPLHVGMAPNKDELGFRDKDSYYALVSSYPKLDEQGDGMRSFASILLNTFTSEYPMTLIDEPEAFLHPPQARILGKMLARNNPNNRQLFISTHSEDFLQGLIDADNNNVTVIRINRINNVNEMSILHNDRIRELWRNPILRYSNILSGLFHSRVIVCESDYDCLFYQAIIDAMYEQKNEIAPDILFTHCGGKNRISDIVDALKVVNVPVVAISDFDIVHNEGKALKKAMTSFGLDWYGSLNKYLVAFYNSVNTRFSTDKNAWDNLKHSGKEGLRNQEPIAYDNIEKECKSAGLFIVPVGEMECFDRTTTVEKKNWVYEVIQKYDLATEPKLESARKFVQEVLDYKEA